MLAVDEPITARPLESCASLGERGGPGPTWPAVSSRTTQIVGARRACVIADLLASALRSPGVGRQPCSLLRVMSRVELG